MLICPSCKNALSDQTVNSENPVCKRCSRKLCHSDGYLVFIPPDDLFYHYDGLENDHAYLKQEDEAARSRINRYFIPLFRTWGVDKNSRILCIGCGSGADVDELIHNGYLLSHGTEIGWRTPWWRKEGRNTSNFYVADGRNLPFENQYFDIVISLGVIEHIGAVGATRKLQSDYKESRTIFLGEALRTLKDSGMLILACPNRIFPIDFQHNISESYLFRKLGEITGISIHSPFNRFLMTYSDIIQCARLLHPHANIFPLPINKYLGMTFRQSPFLRPFGKLFNLYMSLLDKLPSALRMSFINPYMLCMLTKGTLKK